MFGSVANTFSISMADTAEIELKIKAVEFALGSFADYENDEERKQCLRRNFTAIPGLKTYFDFSKVELKDEKKQLQALALLRGRDIMLVFQSNSYSMLCALFRSFCQSSQCCCVFWSAK